MVKRDTTEIIDGKVYCITNNLTGLQYVGQTIQPLGVRFKLHCRSRSNNLLNNAIQLDGKDNFSIKLLDEAKLIDELNFKYDYWIQKLNTLHPNGYNSKLHYYFYDKEKNIKGITKGKKHRVPQFGLKVEGGELILNPEEEDIKRLAIKLKNLGRTYQEIADFFNKREYLTRAKKNWKHNLVRNIVNPSKKRDCFIKFKNLFRSYNKLLSEGQPDNTFKCVSDMVAVLSKKYKFKYKLVTKEATLNVDNKCQDSIQECYKKLLFLNKPIRRSKKKDAVEVDRLKELQLEQQTVSAKQFIQTICKVHKITYAQNTVLTPNLFRVIIL